MVGAFTGIGWSVKRSRRFRPFLRKKHGGEMAFHATPRQHNYQRTKGVPRVRIGPGSASCTARLRPRRGRPVSCDRATVILGTVRSCLQNTEPSQKLHESLMNGPVLGVGGDQPLRSCSAQRAAPTMPASFRNSAGTMWARGFTNLKNFSCLALTPPPIMMSSGQRMSSSVRT